MLPEGNDRLIREYQVVKAPSRTYRMDPDSKRIAGYVDSLEAVEQTVYCILNTERYDNLIYSWNYGAEIRSLYGRPVSFVKSELKRRIKEALLQDDRITDVTSFTFEDRGRTLTVKFCVITDFGGIQARKEVAVHV